MNTPLISDVSNGTAKLKIDWESFKESLPKGSYNTLSAWYPNERIPQIMSSVTSGIEYPRSGATFKR